MIYHQMRDSFIDIVMANGRPVGNAVDIAHYWADRYYAGSVPWETLGAGVQAEWIRITTLLLGGR